MATGVGSLVVNLGLNAVEFTQGLSKAEAQAEKFAASQKRNQSGIDRQVRSLQQQADAFGKSAREVKLFELAQKGATTAQLASANAALRQVEVQQAAATAGRLIGAAALIAAGGLILMAKNAINSLDALNDLKDATGASVENLSALEDVAARTGTSFDTVGTSLVKFNNALKESKPGSDIEAALKAIGLSAKELKALDPAEALLKTATALNSFADDGNKARLTQELFGKSLREVAPFLKDLAEAGKLNATVTSAQALEAEKFNKELFAMGKNLQDAARSIAGPVVEAFNTLIEKFRTARREQTGLFASMDSIRAKAQAASDASFTGSWTSVIDERSASRLKRQGDAGKPSVVFDGAVKVKGGGGGSAKKQSEEISEARRELASYVEGLSRVLEKDKELTEVEKALNFLRYQGAQGQIPQVRELVLGLAKQIDAEKELLRVTEERMKLSRDFALEAGDRVQAENEARQAQIKSLLDATPGAKLNEQLKNEILLRQERDAGRVSEEQYLEAINANFDLHAEKLEKTKSLTEELGLTFTSAFEDAIVGGKKFSDVLKGLEQDIMRIVTRKLVTEPLGNAISGAMGSGDWFSKLFGMFGGSSSMGNMGAAGIVPGFASGTPYVPRDTLAFVHKGERIIPAGQNRAGNVVSITVNQSFAPGTTSVTTMQAAADASRMLQRAGRNL